MKDQRRFKISLHDWLAGRRVDFDAGDAMQLPVVDAEGHFVSKGQLLEYCENAETEKWLGPVLKNIPLVAFGFFFFLVYASFTAWLKPLLTFLAKVLLEPLKPLLAAAPGRGAGEIIGTISAVSWGIYLVMGIAVAWLTVKRACRPTNLALTEGAIALLQKTLPAGRQLIRGGDWRCGREAFLPISVLYWHDIGKVELERPKGKRSVRDYKICLTDCRGKQMRIRWGDLVEPKQRELFLTCLRSRFPRFLDDELVEVFKPAERQSYTELWLKQLSAAPKRDKLTPLSAGSNLQGGAYTILSKVGMGGQGTVYLAASPRFLDNDVVALKEFLLPVYPDPRVRRRAAEKFQEEAAMLAKLNHRQIVRFLDLFIEDHRAYLVLERAEGRTLKDLVASGGAQPEGYAIDLSLQMCEFLGYLHGQEPPVVHRDFTPDNLILGEDGLLRLIDFSVAQQVNAGITGSVVGKPNYISPEQFRGKPTRQSDIYSLGATMFFMLAGHDPEPISVLHPRSECESLSSEIDQVVARATQLDCQRRYASVADLAADLAALPEAKGKGKDRPGANQ